jgi:hypothetical protein
MPGHDLSGPVTVSRELAEAPPMKDWAMVSDWHNIPISLIDTIFGEEKAQSCANACPQELDRQFNCADDRTQNPRLCRMNSSGFH